MTKLRAGYGETIITPPLGLELSGYGFYLDRRAASVHDDLKARVLYLDDGGTPLVIAGCDLIGFNVEDADRVRKALSAALGVPLERILLGCSHTHTGPATLHLPGLGERDAAYNASVPALVVEAARRAAADVAEASFAYASEAVEPIGYNRRVNTFDGVDPYLRAAYFTRADRKIMLLTYACHAVTLGRSTAVSADWPGALIKEVERRGHKAVFLQGFCGDIDPTTNLNRWGAGTEEDLRLYGQILSDRLFKAERYAKSGPAPGLKAAEKRIAVPLAVPTREGVEEAAALFLKFNSTFPLADRFADWWLETARARHDAVFRKPRLENVPVQVLGIGGLRIAALPGEVFTVYGKRLKEAWADIMPVGYAGGDIGYFPPADAYDNPADYGCYCAPMFYNVFPFTRDLEDIFLGAARELFTKLG